MGNQPKLNPQAKELNNIIREQSTPVFQVLSTRGQRIFYPKKGILAQGAEAKGKEINATLGTAYEDDGSPMVLESIRNKINIEPKDIFPYAPSYGLDALRTTWKEQLVKKNPGLDGKNFSKPVVTCALTHGLSMVGYLFVNEGDEIIVADLFWGNYNLVLNNAYGANFKKFNFFKDDRFDIESFKSTLNDGGPGKKIVLLNFPNNPSGYSPTRQAAMAIKEALLEAAQGGSQLVVVLDDAYFGLYFDKNSYDQSMFVELADLHENILAVKVDGITKEEYAWGFRVGFVTFGIKGGNEKLYGALEAKTAGSVRGSISNAPHPSQSLILSALKSKEYKNEKKRNAQKILERYLEVRRILDAHEEYKTCFEALPFNSGYFMCVETKNVNAEAVRQTLLEKYSTGLISITNDGKNLLRIAFAATPTGKLEKLFDNLFQACKELA